MCSKFQVKLEHVLKNNNTETWPFSIISEHFNYVTQGLKKKKKHLLYLYESNISLWIWIYVAVIELWHIFMRPSDWKATHSLYNHRHTQTNQWHNLLKTCTGHCDHRIDCADLTHSNNPQIICNEPISSHWEDRWLK